MYDHMRQRPANYPPANNATYSYNPSSTPGYGYRSGGDNKTAVPMWVLVCSVSTSIAMVVLLVVGVVFSEQLGVWFTQTTIDNEPIDWSECAIESERCSLDKQCCSRVCTDGQCACKDLGEKCTRTENCCAAECFRGECAHFECKEGGTQCVSPEECCSNECLDGLCSAYDEGEECAETSGECEQDFDCCSFICSKGICIDCMEKNENCERNEECCNEHCEEAVGRCKNCNGEGDLCHADSACCSNKCFEGFCVFEDFDPEDNAWVDGGDETDIQDTFEEWEGYNMDDAEGAEEENWGEAHDELPNDDNVGTLSDDEMMQEFIPANTYEGPRYGYKWQKHGPYGPGYYVPQEGEGGA